MVNVLLIGIGTTTLSALESLIAQCNVLGIVRESSEGDPVVSLAQKTIFLSLQTHRKQQLNR